MEANRFTKTETTALGIEPMPRGEPIVINTQSGSTAAVLALSTLGLAACGGGSSSSPSVPSEVTATPGNNQVALAWSASTGATGYTIGRATNSAGPYASIGQSSSASFTDTSAANGTAYFYVVSASYATGTSINSAPVSARCFSAPVCSKINREHNIEVKTMGAAIAATIRPKLTIGKR